MDTIEQLQKRIEKLEKTVELLQTNLDSVNEMMPKLQGILYPPVPQQLEPVVKAYTGRSRK